MRKLALNLGALTVPSFSTTDAQTRVAPVRGMDGVTINLDTCAT